jgi:predicted nucleotidyltransferase
MIEQVIERSSPFEFLPDVRLLTCSAEDLVVLKAFADRSRDWADVEGILARQRMTLDWGHIEEQLSPLAEVKESPEILQRLRQLHSTIR